MTHLEEQTVSDIFTDHMILHSGGHCDIYLGGGEVESLKKAKAHVMVSVCQEIK